MKITLISDLHLEFGPLTLPGGDVLILAGDVAEARTISRHRNIWNEGNEEDHQTASYQQSCRAWLFFIDECSKYQQVFYVMGNHEHYHGKINQTKDELVAILPKNVQLLENESIEYQGVVFFGASLWTDINRGCPITRQTLKNSMNDYRAITFSDGVNYRKLDPADTARLHIQTKNWLNVELANHLDKTVVVITHHAPTFESIAPQYRSDPHMNGGYASDLSELILDNPQIKYWVHGHTHDPFDYMVGTTRVICNPRGYVGHEFRPEEFDPAITFEI